MVDRKTTRTDIKVVEVDANAMAEKLGDKRMSNMVLLGALLGQLGVLPMKAIEHALQVHLPERHHSLLPKNYEALHEGAMMQALSI
jgi:2-oxoglutarate ferredoxin oxidoreductase subunit gamma